MKAKIVWVGIIVGILGLNLLIYGVVIVVTMTDPTFALEPDYERQAADWDSVQRQRAMNQKLGWRVELKTTAGPRRGERTVKVTLLDRDGASLDGADISLSAFHNARASVILESDLVSEGDGVYTSVMPLRRSGIWEFRLTAERKGQVFTAKIRKSLAIRPGGR